MRQIALIYSSGVLYHDSIIITLAVSAAIFGFLSLYLGKSKTPAAAFVTIPIALALSMVLSELIQRYAYPDNYSNFWTAIAAYSVGEFILLGAFTGCILAAVLTNKLGLHKDIPQMLDCMCLSGGAAISVGRLSSFFNTSCRGQIISSDVRLPWVSPVVNTVSGITEYRLSTFLLQAFATAIITIVLLHYERKQNSHRKNGDITLLFLLCYCAAQIVLDSTRYDSISFRSNGFISIVQVTCAVTMVFVIVLLSLRMVRAHGLIVWNLLVWAGMLPLLGITAYMEYYVQRHSDQALLAYSIMAVCLAAVVAMTLLIYRSAQMPTKKPT